MKPLIVTIQPAFAYDCGSQHVRLRVRAIAPSNGSKPCSVLTTPCQQPSKFLKYVNFLGCEFNKDIEQLTDKEDAQAETVLLFLAEAALSSKVPGWGRITEPVTGGAYVIGIAAKSSQECTESVYWH